MACLVRVCKYTLGVTSEKKTDDLKTLSKLVLTPLPLPNFGHFILDLSLENKKLCTYFVRTILIYLFCYSFQSQ